ncbi:flagellar export protein FliJ [Buchnera aphidicola]|uniref:flagellar export protein FliJ n=1 Tax=Buchnera aphidicola TaxID=9 RepID=UPI003463BF77
MKYKKISYSILEDIEKKNIEKHKINIKILYLQREKYIQQLKLLINYRSEYVNRLKNKINSGIYIYEWNNYNDFIFILYLLIENNQLIIKKNKKQVKESLKKWSQNQIKLKTWDYLNNKYKKHLINKKLLREQLTLDEFCIAKDISKRNL